ncbi:DegT/DnrJ/EryC1/StrS family aminotransferase [Nitrospira sp. BLG_2]|uniref:DegT/DnrJ/EryC1/StrS family aminotransferase n=1 Tax=Nitrospira sp. BLG_2 TaxID=3397507 RepID=UPI003B9D7E6C
MEFIDLKKQYGRIKPRIQQRINAVLDHGKFIMGPEVAELEKQLALFVGSKHCVSCANGTDALLLSLLAHEVGPGDAVFTTPFTFIATAEVICLLGATPVFVDVDSDTYNIDPTKLEEAIVDARKGMVRGATVAKPLNPRGIIPVDLFGLPADYDRINGIAKQHGLFVLEDAAQSLGGSYKGKRVGNLADITATSFFPAKPLGGYGDGGAVFTNNDVMADRLRSLREHGKGSHKYDNVRIGINGRLDTLQAAILLPKLEVFESEIKARQDVAERYSSAFKALMLMKVPHVPDGLLSAWAQYSLVVEKRDRYLSKLKELGIPTAVYYPRPLHLQTAFAHLGYQAGDCPIAEHLSDRIFSLPMHPYLEIEDQDRIIEAVRKAHGEATAE